VDRKSFFVQLLFSFLCLNIFSNINLSENFGTKQFIVGVDQSLFIKTTKRKNNIKDLLQPNKHGIRCALFSPKDKVLDVLLYLIRKEKQSIRMAAFLLTDYDIIKAILEAKKRGIFIEIVLDKKAAKEHHKKIRLLKSRGIQVFVYKPNANNLSKNMSNIMHNKFVVFGENVFKRSLIWTGSFNFTYSAHRNNKENIIILDDFEIIARFIHEFDHIKKDLCYAYRDNKRSKRKRS